MRLLYFIELSYCLSHKIFQTLLNRTRIVYSLKPYNVHLLYIGVEVDGILPLFSENLLQVYNVHLFYIGIEVDGVLLQFSETL